MSDDTATYTVAPNGTAPKAVPVRRLSALDKLFEASGEVTIRCGNRDITLPIQAVDLELVESLCRPYRPAPRISVALVNGRKETIAHTAEPEYQDKLTAYNRLNSVVYVLCALQCDIEDKYGTVVWSADNGVHEIDAARQCLRDMGLVDNQLVAILNAAQALTQVVEETQLGE